MANKILIVFLLLAVWVLGNLQSVSGVTAASVALGFFLAIEAIDLFKNEDTKGKEDSNG
jgi:hypothetical protein